MPNNAATAADTSSAAAGNNPVVEAAAAAFAAPSEEPSLDRFDAAAPTISGTAITNDIPHLPTTGHQHWDPLRRRIRRLTRDCTVYVIAHYGIVRGIAQPDLVQNAHIRTTKCPIGPGDIVGAGV